MKSAKVFLIGMYVHIAASMIFPIAILIACADTGWNPLGVGLLAVYLLEVGIVQILGWAAVASAIRLSKRGELGKVRQGWRLLKFASIPFYIINFGYSALVWFILTAASRGLFGLLIPIPLFLTWQMIVQSGFVGWRWLKYKRREPEDGDRPGRLHYLWQILPVADVIDTAVLLRRYRDLPRPVRPPAGTAPAGMRRGESAGVDDPWAR